MVYYIMSWLQDTLEKMRKFEKRSYAHIVFPILFCLMSYLVLFLMMLTVPYLLTPQVASMIIDLWAFSTLYIALIYLFVGFVVYLKRKFNISKNIQAGLLGILLGILGMSSLVEPICPGGPCSMFLEEFLFLHINRIFAIPVLIFQRPILRALEGVCGLIGETGCLPLVILIPFSILWVWGYLISRGVIYLEERISTRKLVASLLIVYLIVLISTIFTARHSNVYIIF